MANTYTISIVGKPLGDPATGVIKRVVWKLVGTDGVHEAFQAGVAELPPIDPKSPTFVPLAKVTVDLMVQWAQSLLFLPGIRALIDTELAAKALPPIVPLNLMPAVEATAETGVVIAIPDVTPALDAQPVV